MTVVAAVFSLLAGYVVFRNSQAARFPLVPIDLRDAWVQAPGGDGYAGFFRFTVDLESSVTNAWIAISACDGFEVTVNEDPVARHYVWRPTRPFQNGLSERGQRLTSEGSLVDLNFPREYQWSGHDSYRLPIWIDIRPELRRGRNVIGIQIESRRAPAKFALVGGITLATGKYIPLKSGAAWQATDVPAQQARHDWTQVRYDDQSWMPAKPSLAPAATTWRSFDNRSFTTPFGGQLIESPQATAASSVWFQSKWKVVGSPNSAWIRLLTTRNFDLFINDKHVTFANTFMPDADAGQWVMGSNRAQDPQQRPTILDPDETDSPFVGDRFESPPSGDPTLMDFRALPLSSRELKPRGSHVHSSFTDKYAALGQQSSEAKGGAQGNSYPHGVRPSSQQRDRFVEDFVSYDISRIVRPGENTIQIRLAEPNTSAHLNWPARMAVDGQVATDAGDIISIQSNGSWTTRTGNGMTWQQASARPLPAANISALPRLQYRGQPTDTRLAAKTCSQYQLGTLAFVVGFLSILFSIVRVATRPANWELVTTRIARLLFGVLLVFSLVLSVGVLVQCAFAERHEALWFLQAGTWTWLLLSALWIGIVFGLIEMSVRGEAAAKVADPVSRWSLRNLPQTAWWRAAIWLVLALSLFTRAYRLEFQPLDDDEYASTQAILSIAETGIPRFAAEGVWYTRSPLFHYVMGACTAILGGNLWTMRFPNVLFGVMTCWLTYLIGSRLLRRPWVGMGAMLILALHPFEVYTGHVIRFYQMQQMLALLTVYCFCRGFVTQQSSRYRLLTVLAFLATVLSQEASSVMGFSLLLGYVIFADEATPRTNLRLVISAVCALVIIGLDYFTFETRCMTRAVGISPNLEATINPHLWHPYNFLSLFIGYSRLHLFGSLFLLCGLPWLCRQRDRCTMALCVIMFSGVVFTNIFVTHISLRYQYWLIPLWGLLSLEGMRAILTRLTAYGLNRTIEAGRHRRLIAAASCVCFAGCLAVLSPWRMVGSYDHKLLGDSTGAMQFVRANLRAEDRVMVTEPHTHAALLEIGRVDYDLSVPLLYDFTMSQGGKLIDRNGAATVIGDLEHLADVLRTHDRVWIAINHEKLRSRGKNLRWEYPAARVESFLRCNCQLVHKTYLWSVYLWDVQEGQFSQFRSHQI